MPLFELIFYALLVMISLVVQFYCFFWFWRWKCGGLGLFSGFCVIWMNECDATKYKSSPGYHNYSNSDYRNQFQHIYCTFLSWEPLRFPEILQLCVTFSHKFQEKNLFHSIYTKRHSIQFFFSIFLLLFTVQKL